MKPSNTIDVLYDGNCAFLCRAIHLLRHMDRQHHIHLTNTAARKFDARIFDKSMNELIAEIHARMPDGTWLKGMDAFRLLSSSVGLGPLVLLTRLPLIRLSVNVGYLLVADFSNCSLAETGVRHLPLHLLRSRQLNRFGT